MTAVRGGPRVWRWRFFLSGAAWTVLLAFYGLTMWDWRFWPLNTAAFITASVFERGGRQSAR